MNQEKIWHKVLDKKEDLQDGRVMTVMAGNKAICLTHFEGKITALDNECPHQKGPLGEGSIENGWLRCPWHGWDFHPCTGKSPGAYGDGIDIYETKEESDAIYVAILEEKEAPKTIADVVVETMVHWGIDTVFGMVGHSNLGLAEAFRKKEEEGKLQFIDIRHEGAASFAASAYGKLLSRPAACFAIAGPGATNMFTGMWDAKVDRAPLLVLTGQVATQVVGTGNFQEIDLVRAFQTVAEFNHRIQKDSKHAELVSLAVKHAILKRDVSHLTFPDEVQITAVSNKNIGKPQGRMPDLHISPPTEQLNISIKKIKEAKNPAIVVGAGARVAMPTIIKIAEQLSCPILTTFKAKGLVSDHHPLACGVLGRSGTPIASYFMNEADLLIVFGASFSNHTGIDSKTPTIQIDFDPLALAKFHAIETTLFGEIDTTARLILDEIAKVPAVINKQASKVQERWDLWRQEKQSRLADNRNKGLSSISVFEALNELVEKNAVICVDVGNNAYSFGRYFEASNQRILMSGYLGSIGFAFPAAMGAWAATRNETPQIIAIAGDGGFAQYMAELTTSVKYKMNIKLILLNNSELGKISKEQRAGHWDVWKTKLLNPNFANYANDLGALGKRVEKNEDLHPMMQEVLQHKGTALLEVVTDPMLI